MIASVHLADVGLPTAARVVLRRLKPAAIPGLRQAQVAVAAALGTGVLPSPNLRRVALLAFWDDDAAVDRFLAEHPMAATLGGGWQVRLEPLRRFGSWPGLPDDIPVERAVGYDGPAAVLTLGRLRMTQLLRFLRTSSKAERSVLAAPGLVWATGLTRPPFVATCSLWERAQDAATYAYGRRDPGHPDAIATDRAKPFHHQSAFVRFRPYGSAGSLQGRNPLGEAWMSPA
jgi:hypothetical protein